VTFWNDSAAIVLPDAKLIGPFRHWIVYPALMRQIERAWYARGVAARPPS
jgi:hypothetical protein